MKSSPERHKMPLLCAENFALSGAHSTSKSDEVSPALAVALRDGVNTDWR